MNDPGDSTPSSTVSADPGTAEAEPPERPGVTVIEQAGDWSAISLRAAAIAEAAAALARHPRCEAACDTEACVVLADDALLRSLNRDYRGKDAPTNVLSFPFQALPAGDSNGGGEPRQLGDVVLAAETVLSEAAEQGIAPVHHLQHLVVHGLLHLLGFDHDTDASADDMERLEAEILATLGIANPYALAEGGVGVA
jgi:probable rRNA maturation factor